MFAVDPLPRLIKTPFTTTGKLNIHEAVLDRSEDDLGEEKHFLSVVSALTVIKSERSKSMFMVLDNIYFVTTPERGDRSVDIACWNY